VVRSQNYPHEALSERETVILRLMADGLSHGEIADHLGISLNTVKWHVQHIYDKLNVKRRSQAVAVARSAGLLEEATPGHDSAEEGQPRHNLPPQPTTFVGRHEELEVISRLLDDPACRLLTLVGPGGIGKTRLAIEAAFRSQVVYPDGVYFVTLQPLTTPFSPSGIMPVALSFLCQTGPGVANADPSLAATVASVTASSDKANPNAWICLSASGPISTNRLSNVRRSGRPTNPQAVATSGTLDR
jgi:DNA-binding CsgD family transcriptional regulator